MYRRSWLTSACGITVLFFGTLGLLACGGGSSPPSEPGSPSPSHSASPAVAKHPSTKYAWAVGALGVIRATTDGGAHWKAQRSGTRYDLSSVSFADTMHGWAVGGYVFNRLSSDLKPASLVLVTTDGGAHWLVQNKAPGQPFAHVACSDPAHVWVAGGGETAKISASSDGGKTWMTQYADKAPGEIAAITFVDASHGWAIEEVGALLTSESAKVLATTDGGSHWAFQATLPGNASWAVTFANATLGWVVGNQAGPRVWSTTDGGVTWKRTPAPHGKVAELHSVEATDVSHVWIGSLGLEDSLSRSTNGGRTWLAPAAPIRGFDAGALAFASTSHGWALTLSNSLTYILATTDCGATWTTQAKIGGLNDFWALSDITCLSGTGSPSQ